MKGTENFEKIIHDHLLKFSKNDKAFEAKFNNPKKNIKDCITYILITVQKSGCNGSEWQFTITMKKRLM